MEEGAERALAAGEVVVPESEARMLRVKVRELELELPRPVRTDRFRNVS